MLNEDLKLKLEQIINGLGYELYDLIVVRQKRSTIIRILIDKDSGYIGVSDCAIVSKAVDNYLIESEYKHINYFLEVNSPGLDRRLKKDEHFERYKEQKVKLRTSSPIDGRKNFQGVLKGLNDNRIKIIDDEGNELIFNKEDVADVRLIPILNS